jgi:3-hydroxy-3-methylglutaryl CoA synthase
VHDLSSYIVVCCLLGHTDGKVLVCSYGKGFFSHIYEAAVLVADIALVFGLDL